MKLPKVKKKISSYLQDFAKNEYDNLICFVGDETGFISSKKVVNLGIFIAVLNSAGVSAGWLSKKRVVEPCDNWGPPKIDSHGTSCLFVTEDVDRYKDLLTPPTSKASIWKHVVFHQNFTSVDKLDEQLIMGQQNCFEKVSVFHSYCNRAGSCTVGALRFWDSC